MPHPLLTLVLALGLWLAPLAASQAAGPSVPLPQYDWQFKGLGGQWDKAQILRGWQVATQVCLQCHGLQYVRPRDLMGLGFTEAQVEALATQAGVDLGQPLKTALSDEDMKATYGMVVPDLSVMALARPDGVNYLKALLLGYTDAPADFTGTNYNKYFPGHNIAMPNPLSDGQITYADGSPETVTQYSADVAAFLAWAADPHHVTRQNVGTYVLIFISLMVVLTYVTMKAIWRDVKGK